jgi:anti-sigma regulatory factor (Ser/Thr protein kinase)
MAMTFHTAITISDSSQIGETRRTAFRLGQALGLDDTQCGAASIIATELATNLSRYARAGQILIGASPDQTLEILSVDKGPGMDVPRCLQDGYSSGGTPGNGLGAVRRLAADFDAYSCENGSVVFARVAQSSRSQPLLKSPIEHAALSLPAPLETVCGNSWCLDLDEEQLRVLVVDGLGHGPDAAAAADAATELFQRHSPSHPSNSLSANHSQANSPAPKDFIEQAHGALAGTRGAALAVASLSLADGRLRYAGIGNIGGSLLTAADSRGLMSHNGTVGARMRTVQELEYEWPSGSLLIMYSDGIQNRWDLRKYPGLHRQHPAVIASVLMRDFTRGRDDVTVLVVRRL